jgi:hypothetical protein
MHVRASSFFWLGLAGVIWPCLVIALAFLSPGPSNAISSLPQGENPQLAFASPPVDQSGTMHIVAGPRGVATAEVFWEQPTKARVKISIQLPAEGAGTPAPR